MGKPKSDHFDGKRFFNPGNSDSVKSLFDVLKWQVTKDRKKWPTESARRVAADRRTLLSGQLRLTWINHATYLIESTGLNILTDPVFSLRTSPSQLIGPKRVVAPGIAFDGLPPIHVVLVSHNHYDHMDKESLRKLEAKFHPQFIVPLGNKALLEGFGCQHVIEIDWWEKARAGGAEFSLVPAQHWSGRGVGDRLKTLWGGFVFTVLDRQIFFAGDTGYGPHFGDIARSFGGVDIALLPIGAYEPRWFMKGSHMNPDDAVKAHQDIRAKQSLGMHFGTFQMTDEGIEDPIDHLALALRRWNIEPSRFIAPRIGESFYF